MLGDCAEDLACIPEMGDFVCVPTVAPAQPGAPCEAISGCTLGHFCAPSAGLLECGDDSCCTAYCDISAPDTCDGAAVCVPFYPPGKAPAGHENVGFCGLA